MGRPRTCSKSPWTQHPSGALRRRAWPGISLAEVLVASSVMVVVLGIALPFLVTVHTSWRDNEERATAFDEARAATVFIAKGVRGARRFSNVPSASDPHGVLGTDVLGPDGDPHQQTYYFDATDAPPGLGWVRLLDINLDTGATTDARVAGPVQSLSFDMRQSDGVTPASNPWEARLVRIAATGATGQGSATFPVVVSTLRRGGPPTCALFCAGNLSLDNHTVVTGDVYAGGDLVLGQSSSVREGLAYAAGSVVGNGAIVGPRPTPTPSLPTLDTGYYDDLLMSAESVPKGDMDWNTGQIPLGGSTVRVRGRVMLRGTAELMGPGVLVITGRFSAFDDARISGAPRIIVGRDAEVLEDVQIAGGGLLYAREGVTVDDRAFAEADLVTPGYVRITRHTTVTGLVYGTGAGYILGNVRGGAYIGSDDAISGADLVADVAVASHSIPGLRIRY